MDSRIIFTSHKEDFLMGEIVQQILTRNYFVQFVAKSLASLLTRHVQFKKGIDCQKVVPDFVATALFGIRVYQ